VGPSVGVLLSCQLGKGGGHLLRSNSADVA